MPREIKTEVGLIDGTPEKRMFWSIIADYDVPTGICELIDNALDLWVLGGKKSRLRVGVNLDVERQTIRVTDDAGGVPEDELRLLITPGGSRNDPRSEIIGIFGVGGKRAAIALGEYVRIKTRHRKGATSEVDIDPDWLSSPDWRIATYKIADIRPGTTEVEISHLRKPFTSEDVSSLASHLGQTYSWFLRNGCEIMLNGRNVLAIRFDHWAYPKGFNPQQAKFDIDLGDEGTVVASITAGLIHDRDPQDENYGAYFYCNHRLIAGAQKTREVGYYATSEAGVPHPDASLCRAIVELQGPAILMLWNSSKSGMNVGHPVFQQLRPTLVSLITYFSSLSRRLKHDWNQKVFANKVGEIELIDAQQATSRKRLHLPPLPRVNKPHVEKLKARNKKQLREQPWTLGLIEAIAAVDVITRQRFETKNRMALVLLDSNFEIALKEFVVHRPDLFSPKQFTEQLFRNRNDVIKAVTDVVPIPQKYIARARHYYAMRNKLIHERATVDITDSDISNYQRTIEFVLATLFGLKFNG